MVRRQISEAQRWQIIGMHTTGMSFKAIGHQMGYHYNVVSRLVRKQTQTNNVKDCQDPTDHGQHLIVMTGHCSVWLYGCHSQPVSYSSKIGFPIDLSTITIRNRLKSAGLKSRTVIKRPLLADRHRRLRFGMVFRTTWLQSKDMAQNPLIRREPVSASCNRRLGDRLETQQYSLYSKEYPANCPLRWRLRNGLGCIFHDCKLDLVTIQGNLAGDQYVRDVLQPVVVPHIDNHLLATKPVYMDHNARPLRSRAVTAYLQSEA